MEKPIIFEFLEASHYLREIYNYRKFKETNFSYDKWTQEIGLQSRSYLRSIVIGEKKLVNKLIPDFISALNLNDLETSYFLMLVHYSNADDKKIREIYGKQLLQSWKKHIYEIQITDVEGFLADAIIPVLFTYLSFGDTGSQIDEIAKDLGCASERIDKALRYLVWQKLVDGDLDDQGNIKYKTIKEYFQIPTSNGSAAIKSFHLQGMDLAKEAMSLPAETRRYFSRFMALSEKDFLDFENYLNEYLDKLMSKYDSAISRNKRIYRINIQILPVSNTLNQENI